MAGQVSELKFVFNELDFLGPYMVVIIEVFNVFLFTLKRVLTDGVFQNCRMNHKFIYGHTEVFILAEIARLARTRAFKDYLKNQ